ncbi:MAG: NADH:ubiquinone oxidoreductase subunit N [Gammaproteobacteria bacterium]|nr:NADH:ubiquinone oxidoreductase subunit N [Gammaproteobacteria bacterium]
MMNFLFIMPEIIITTSMSVILLIDLFLKKKNKIISYYLIQFTLLFLIFFLIRNFEQITSLNHQDFSTDIFSIVFKTILLSGLIIIFYYSYNFLRYFKVYKTEYFLICLFGLLGMMIITSAQDLLILYLGIELLSLSLYSIIAYNKDSAFSSEAAIKYYVLGAIASGFLLFGISLIYGLTGTISLNEVFQFIYDSGSRDAVQNVGYIFALTFIIVSLGFKFGAAPFHMWIPDVYHGSLLPTTLLLSSLPKIAVFIIFIKLLLQAFIGLFHFWADMILILALISIVIGNIIAIVQTNFKRMLAYSTIANIGFILIGISLGTQESFTAATFYTLSYVIMSMAIFGILTFITINGKAVEEISDLSGLNENHPWQAFLILLTMLSLAGIPPLIGFHAKLFLIQVLVNSSYFIIALFAVIMTVIGAYYYLRVIKVIYFDKVSTKINLIISSLIVSINTLLLLYLGLFPYNLVNLSKFLMSGFFST